MTHNQFPAYEFEPTLTTSELNALIAERDAREAYEAEQRKAEEAEYERSIASQRRLRDYERRIASKFEAYIANPTVDGAKSLVADVDFYSDIYKDEYHVRPHGCWDAYFLAFDENHRTIWEQGFNAYLG